MILGKLAVVLGAGRLVAGCHAAVDPFGRFEHLTGLRDLRRTEDLGNLQQHGSNES
jgi:hypothetical protein